MAPRRTGRVEVFRHLIRQVYDVKAGRALTNGKLVHFRAALATEFFPKIVRWTKSILKEDLFSTLEQIERMEIAYGNHDRVTLIVQCCLIFELCNSARLIAEAPPSDTKWMFEDCYTLGDIAYMRSRLRFVKRKSCLREAVDDGFILAVQLILARDDPEWDDLLLVLVEASPYCVTRLLAWLLRKFEKLPEEVPGPAATLFLSFVSDAIYFLSSKLGDTVCERAEKSVEKLLELGASPMITRENHLALLELITRECFQTDGAPWWLGDDRAEPVTTKRHPTTLYKLLFHRWNPKIMEGLSQFTCCSLDASGILTRNFGSSVPDLKCLAAQRTASSDVDKLPSLIKLFALKHQSSPPDRIEFEFH